MSAASVVSTPIYVGLVEGFAALGAVVGVASASLAFLALITGRSIQEIGNAVNYGIAYGFLPGALLGGYIFATAGITL